VEVLAGRAKLTIFTAAGVGKIDQMALLLKKDKKLVHAKRDDGRTPLHFAAAGGQKAAAVLLLATNAHCNANSAGVLWDWHRSPLHDAVANGHTPVAEVLLAHKANVNAKDNLGRTSLHIAASDGQVALSKLLLTHKADVNARADGVYFGP